MIDAGRVVEEDKWPLVGVWYMVVQFGVDSLQQVCL